MDLDPRMTSALDQMSGLVAQIGDMTVNHHQRLTDGHLPPDLTSTLCGDLHDALLALFLPAQSEDD